MAKLAVKIQKLFANIGATGTTGQYQVTQFGSLKAAVPLATTNPTTIQALAAYDYGFVSAIINGGPPAIQDLDGLCSMLSTGVAYLQQAGIPEYHAGQEYKVGSFCSSTSGAIFRSVAAANIGNALTDETKWMLFNSQLSAAINASYAIKYNEKYIYIYGTNPDMDVTLPLIGAHNKGRTIYVVSKSNQITSVSASGTDTLEVDAGYKFLSPKYSIALMSDGVSNWNIIGYCLNG